jgi:hypothetical protein|tara:strand:+ start:60 stop:293 length:234 start_codon:yes stop_codon:yes gene_type:complete
MGDIVQEVNYIAYFHNYQKPLVGIVIELYQIKKQSWENTTRHLARVYWFKSKKFEMMPIYLLAHYNPSGDTYESDKI